MISTSPAPSPTTPAVPLSFLDLLLGAPYEERFVSHLQGFAESLLRVTVGTDSVVDGLIYFEHDEALAHVEAAQARLVEAAIHLNAAAAAVAADAIARAGENRPENREVPSS